MNRSRRPIIDRTTVTELLWLSDRTCNLCMRERHHLEIHHINGRPDDNRFDNLIVLCRNCHSEASARSLGRRISGALLIKYKKYWGAVVATRREAHLTRTSAAMGSDPGVQARRAAERFEELMSKRDARGVLAMFTPPRTPKERGWLEGYILGGDLGTPGDFIRLFATRGFGYRVLNFEVRRVKVINAKQAEVKLEEWLTWWGNGRWDSVPRSRRTVLTILKFGRGWLVEKYTQPGDPNYRHKYGGLSG